METTEDTQIDENHSNIEDKRTLEIDKELHQQR